MPGRDDDVLHDYLEAQDPAEFDAFIRALNKALTDALPAIRRKVENFRGNHGDNFDVDHVISQGIERALELLQAQYLGQNTKFRFERGHNLSFSGWILRIIGRPGGGVQSGFVGTELKKAARRTSRHAAFEDSEISFVENSPDDMHDASASLDLNGLLAQLPPNEQFVLRAEAGVHEFGPLTDGNVGMLARHVAFEPQEVRRIKRRARLLTARAVSPRLSQTEIGALLDVGERQVYNIKRRAIQNLRDMTGA